MLSTVPVHWPGLGDEMFLITNSVSLQHCRLRRSITSAMYTVTCCYLPQSTGGVHILDGPNGFPTEIFDRALSPPSLAPSSGTIRLPCVEVFPLQKCILIDIRHRDHRTDADTTPTASPSAAHVLVSQTFTPGLIRSLLAQFPHQLCSLVVSLPHEDLEHLCDLFPASGEPRCISLTSTFAVAPLPPGLARHIISLKTLLLHNIVPTWNPPRSLYSLTTLSLVDNSQHPVPFDYEYKISDFFEFLLCTPQLRHLWLSGIGPTIYNVTSDWVVPLEFLETLHLHHCRLQVEILRHLSISFNTREISVHTRVQSAHLYAGAVFYISSSRWEFTPFSVNFHQEGTDSCRLLFVGTRLQESSGDNLSKLPALTLEISIADTAQRFNTAFSGRCIRSFRSLSVSYIRELTVHSYRRPQGQMENPVYTLLRSLSSLGKLVLKGCDESPFYEALSRIRVQGTRGRRGLSVVCPHLTVVEINPIVEFQRYLGDQTPPCRRLVEDLSKMMQKRKGCGAPLKRLQIVFPAQCREEVRYVEKKLFFDFGMWAVRVKVARAVV